MRTLTFAHDHFEKFCGHELLWIINFEKFREHEISWKGSNTPKTMKLSVCEFFFRESKHCIRQNCYRRTEDMYVLISVFIIDVTVSWKVVWNLRKYYTFLSFFHCFSHFEHVHIIKKCDFIKTIIHKNKYIQRLEIKTGKTCEACNIIYWGETCRRP